MPPERDTVYLVDGSSYLHRAYHAIRNLSNSQGFPTNAVFGFTRMVLKLLADKNPAYLAVVFDAKGPTFRHKIYPQYKANRPPMPESMAMQVPLTKGIVRNLSISMLEMEGFEADDIMGTIARLCEQKGCHVVLVTGDKDFRQIITPQTCMWDTMKDKETGYDSLQAEYEFEPARFIDVMALSGDSSDNIPGVPGVGEKTAVKLVKEFGRLEDVLQRAEQVKQKKLKENLQAYSDQALLSKQLVTIDRYVPLEMEIEALRVGRPERNKLAETFRELEFKGLWEQFASRRETPRDYNLCLSWNDLQRLIERIRHTGCVSVDTETTSRNPLQAELVGLSVAWKAGAASYLPVGHRYPGAPPQLQWSEVLGPLQKVLADEHICKVGHNLKYDAIVLQRHGLELKGIYFDTMIASYVNNPGLRQHKLDDLAQHYLNHKMISYPEVLGKEAENFSEVPLDRATEYACEDADVALRLMEALKRELEAGKNKDLFHKIEMKLLPVLQRMEMAGIQVDISLLKQISAKLTRQLQTLESEIYREAGMKFNINSPQQLGEVLFEKLQLPVQKKTTKSKRYSTDVKVLKRLCAFPHPMPRLMLQYRRLAKLKSTYLDSLVNMVQPATGRLHTSYNQTATATGRLSSSSPNLQNIPIRGNEGREIRKAFISGEGQYLLAADYSQVELRIFAHYAQDRAFMEAFANDQDIHARTAAEIMNVPPENVTAEMRRVAKAINFGIIYGMGPQKLSEELEIDRKTAKSYIEAYYEKHSGVVSYREEMIAAARKQGYVQTLLNRRRYLPDIEHGNRVVQAEAERMAINTPIQGTAADLIKIAMIRIDERLRHEKMRTRMLLQVHDELVFEVPEEELAALETLVKAEMEGVYELRVPLQVDIKVGRSWGEAH